MKDIFYLFSDEDTMNIPVVLNMYENTRKIIKKLVQEMNFVINNPEERDNKKR
jgi:hypothetical protein